jgi:diguanylate cyclase (GGDEF)-like protein
MVLDYNSLLLAIGFSAACLSITLLATWLSARTEGFILTWAVGAALVVAGIFAYDRYVQVPGRLIGVVSFGVLLSALAILVGAGRQFRLDRTPWRISAAVTLAACGAVLPFMIIGLTGIAFILFDIAAAALLLAAAREYWLARSEAPLPVAGLVVLYAMTAISFTLCAATLATSGTLVLDRAPENWAENANVIVSIAGLSGVGALSLALNQSRLARRHRLASMTDGLTGLLNRRALFDRFGRGNVLPDTAFVLFDLDRFKAINDRHGHAAGDEVLRRFAVLMRAELRATDFAGRLGGEEFLAVLPRSTPGGAAKVAERIRERFAAEPIPHEGAALHCTVSAGMAIAGADGASLDALLAIADRALYDAKRGGRNRLEPAHLSLAG